MYKIKSKKGIALVFLMELILLVMFISLLFLSAGRLITNESKYYDLDAQNLASFLERIPAIEGNFYYNFSFINASNVKVTTDSVYLSKADKQEYTHSASYHTLRDYFIEFEHKNVNSIYFYKIGTDIFVTKEPDAKYEKQLLKVEDLPYESTKINYKLTPQNPAYSLAEQVNSYNSNVNSENMLTLNHIFGVESHPYNDISIKYTLDSKAIAHSMYNHLIDSFSAKENPVTIGLFPTPGVNNITLVIHSSDSEILSYTNAGMQGFLS